MFETDPVLTRIEITPSWHDNSSDQDERATNKALNAASLFMLVHARVISAIATPCSQYTVLIISLAHLWYYQVKGSTEQCVFLCPAFAEHTVFVVSVRNGSRRVRSQRKPVDWGGGGGHTSATHTFLVSFSVMTIIPEYESLDFRRYFP